MKKRVVILYGPPGSGKGTQSYLISVKLGLIQFDIGSYLESIVHDPKNKSDPFIQEQRKKFDSGELCDSKWVMRIVGERIKAFSRGDFSIVLSGSFRTMEETFGKNNKGLLSVIEKLYGKENIIFIYLDIPEKVSMERNSNRKVCSICDHPVIHFGTEQHTVRCPICAGPLRERTLDKPSIIQKRLMVFHEELEPVLEALKTQEFSLKKFDADKPPFLVFEKIRQWLL